MKVLNEKIVIASCALQYGYEQPAMWPHQHLGMDRIMLWIYATSAMTQV